MTFSSFRAELVEVGRSLPENLVVVDTATSTNRYARRLLAGLVPEALPPAPCFVVAHEQTRGRGRLDRAWVSAAGQGLYCSLLLPLDDRGAPPLLPLAVGVALCEAMREAGVGDCRLKWPNDLLVGRRKLGGVLIEVVARRSAARATAIVGVGINLDLGGRLDELGATAVNREGGEGVTVGRLLMLMAAHLRSILPIRDAAPVVEAFRELICHRHGDAIAWRQGSQTIRGLFGGIDDDGRLAIETDQGRRAVSVGDIIE